MSRNVGIKRSAMQKLSDNDKHLLRLIHRSEKRDGWASVSQPIWPFIAKLPSDLVELQEVGFSGIVKLTREGETVLKWLL